MTDDTEKICVALQLPDVRVLKVEKNSVGGHLKVLVRRDPGRSPPPTHLFSVLGATWVFTCYDWGAEDGATVWFRYRRWEDRDFNTTAVRVALRLQLPERMVCDRITTSTDGRLLLRLYYSGKPLTMPEAPLELQMLDTDWLRSDVGPAHSLILEQCFRWVTYARVGPGS